MEQEQDMLMQRVERLPEELEIKIYEYIHQINFYACLRDLQRTRSFLLSIPVIKKMFINDQKPMSRYILRLCRGYP